MENPTNTVVNAKHFILHFSNLRSMDLLLFGRPLDQSLPRAIFLLCYLEAVDFSDWKCYFHPYQKCNRIQRNRNLPAKSN